MQRLSDFSLSLAEMNPSLAEIDEIVFDTQEIERMDLNVYDFDDIECDLNN